jgi:hypothetical protein
MLRTLATSLVLAVGAAFAPAQVVEAPIPAEGVRTRAWSDHPAMEVLKRQEWLVTARFRVASRAPGHEVRTACCPTTEQQRDIFKNIKRPGWRASTNRPTVNVQREWIVLPVVSEGAMQRVHLESLKSTSQLESATLNVPARMLASHAGMHQEIGWRFDAMPRGSLNWRVAEVEMQFHADLRTVRFDRAKLASIGWPSAWPDETAGAMQPQAYIDFAPDAGGFMRELDPGAMEQMFAEIDRAAGLTRERRLAPSEVAHALAGAVHGTIRQWRSNSDPLRQGQFPRTHPRVFGITDDDALIRPSRDPDTLTGLQVRDVLSVWRDGRGTPAERCAVLVAALRKWGIPARLMIGVELDETDRKEAISPRVGMRTITIETACGTRSFVIPRPATIVAWVEFALAERVENADRVTWIPIDPGSGGNSWKFGTLTNGQYTVALATSLWPQKVRFVGRTGASIGVWRGQLDAWNPRETGWHLPAAMFGMQSEQAVYTACAAEWRVTGRKASRREMDRFIVQPGNLTREAATVPAPVAPAPASPAGDPAASPLPPESTPAPAGGK